MSKFIPDPQIQSLRPMRAGDIAFAQGGTITIGKQSVALRSPEGIQSVAPVAVPTTPAISGPFNESPVTGVVDTTSLSADASANITPVAVESTPAISGPFNESPLVGVKTGTSVV